jgi:hypothetical protein
MARVFAGVSGKVILLSGRDAKMRSDNLKTFLRNVGLTVAAATLVAASLATASAAEVASASAAVAPAAAATAVAAAPAKSMPLSLELNAVTQAEKTCRLSFRISNDMKAPVEDMALELVLFDWNGATERFVVVRTGPIPEGRSRVRQYDMPDLDCTLLGSVLLNDISECNGPGLNPGVCLDQVAVASKAAATFEY